MKIITSLLVSGLALAFTTSCQHKVDPTAACPDVLEGTWYLVDRVPVPKTDETIILTASRDYSVFRNGILSAQGTYAISQDMCAGGAAVPFVRFTPATPGQYAPDGAYRLRDCTLVIEQCSAAGSTVLTYKHPID